MREFFQSCTTLAFSLSLLSLKLVDDVTSMDGDEFRGAATRAVEAVSGAAVDQLGPRLRSTFRNLNDVQRGVVGIMFDLSLALAASGVRRLADETGAYRRGRRSGIDQGDIRGGGTREYRHHAASTTSTTFGGVER